MKDLEQLLLKTLAVSSAPEALPVEVVLYGAGAIGRDSLRLLQAQGINVRCFLDAKSKLTTVEGVPVLRPDDASFDEAQKAGLPVIITIFNSFVLMTEVEELLHREGWDQVIGFLAFHRQHATVLGDHFWLTHPSFYLPRQNAWNSAASLWADEQSTLLYRQILQFRFSGNYEDCPPIDKDRQYLPDTIPGWPRRLRFVDCGAYDGDTVEMFTNQGCIVEALAAFEPDSANLAICVPKLSVIAPVADPAVLWPCGVHSTTTQLRFTSGKGSGSAISAHGESVIQCVALDDALGSFRPNLIKMDIEGAELAALEGARRIITKNSPALAICLYHKPAHLWQIPLLLSSWNLGYRFYLRVHSHNGFELVMYAVPTS